jgi:hypothetical protein
MRLEPSEVSILRELRSPTHVGWLDVVEIAERLDMPAWQVRANLYQLNARYLVTVGNRPLGHYGEWSITANGMVELARADTLRLVR